MEAILMACSFALIFVGTFGVVRLEQWGGAPVMALAALVGIELLARIDQKIERADRVPTRLSLQITAMAGFAAVIGYSLLRLACNLPSPGQYLYRLLVAPIGHAPIEIDLVLLIAALVAHWLRYPNLRLKLIVPSTIAVLGFFLDDWDLCQSMFWPMIFFAGFVFSEMYVVSKKFVSSSFYELAIVAAAVVSALPPILAATIIAAIVMQFMFSAPRLWLRACTMTANSTLVDE